MEKLPMERVKWQVTTPKKKNAVSERWSPTLWPTHQTPVISDRMVSINQLIKRNQADLLAKRRNTCKSALFVCNFYFYVKEIVKFCSSVSNVWFIIVSSNWIIRYLFVVHNELVAPYLVTKNYRLLFLDEESCSTWRKKTYTCKDFLQRDCQYDY